MTKIKVLHYSTHHEDCGIGRYDEQFIEAMNTENASEVHNEFFSYSPNITKLMSHDDFTKVLDELRTKLQEFDILHIQHEMSFYTKDELSRMIEVAHQLGKKVVITIHTALDAQYKQPQRNGYGPHSIVAFLREKKVAEAFTRTHIEPMCRADLILVHNNTTKENLIKHGVDAANITIIILPVPYVKSVKAGTVLHKALGAKDDDIIVGMVGFISKTKGVKAAVKALKLLPENYKLALIGGIHPTGAGEDYYDEVTDLTIELGLTDRVYVTGYMDDDDERNRLVMECDVFVYPYDKHYYQYVSSAALNDALANGKPAIVYPTRPFIEMNGEGTVAVCKSPNYYELAREITGIDRKTFAQASKEYAQAHSYLKEAGALVAIYAKLVR
jgi:glycosyltransferase involved in cell wall biosynthesis